MKKIITQLETTINTFSLSKKELTEMLERSMQNVLREERRLQRELREKNRDVNIIIILDAYARHYQSPNKEYFYEFLLKSAKEKKYIIPDKIRFPNQLAIIATYDPKRKEKEIIKSINPLQGHYILKEHIRGLLFDGNYIPKQTIAQIYKSDILENSIIAIIKTNIFSSYSGLKVRDYPDNTCPTGKDKGKGYNIDSDDGRKNLRLIITECNKK